ncbi:N-acetylneuraminate lyase [Petrotoga sp. HKA.pet.4.5]|uniref:dihydrodipicolinate synthase family protein n=1 Tax=unclassified Petrotoga TaxID=2620614 RepID=UPI000EF145A3|nr:MULTISPECIES: dihydrodipicolinate synthase family protein [unclassified Petrotoga]RLL82357.1 N-acetylneuraminate lyase [Petrotoga sp. Shatin.DS.tank11.9.2.9.3]RLL90068.1 N-acetylneuraminate lyase [Petrotoga sp. HKA.pet.4.5]
MANFQINEIKGVIPAILSIFNKEEEIDEKSTRSFIDFLLDQGVNGLYLTGSTGEAFLMNLEERKKYVEIVAEQVKGKVPIIVHIGAIGTRNSIELAKHAYKIGADAISSVPPFYWKFQEENIIDYYKDIAASVPLPFIIYNIPLAGILTLDIIKKLANIENIKGIKYTATTHDQISSIKDQISKDFFVYSGCDEMAISGLINGADGIIGSFLNLMPELFIEIYEAIENKDLITATGKQKDAIRIIEYSLHFDYFSVIRLGLKWLGIDAGYSRRPFKNYDTDEEKIIKKGFIELREKYQIKGVKFLDSL